MSFLEALWKYLILSAPPLLLGFILAGLIRAFLTPQRILPWLGKGNIKDVFWASLFGVPLPLCSCSVVPTAMGLHKQGASKASTAAFLISTPESGVDSIIMTYSLMDWPMTLFRPLAAFLSGAFAGLGQLLFNTDKKASSSLQSHKASESCCYKISDLTNSSKKENQDRKHDHHDHQHDDHHEHHHHHQHHQHHQHDEKNESPEGDFAKLKGGFKWAMTDLVNDLAFWLAVGIIGGAFLDWLIPADFFLGYSPLMTKFLMVVIGIPLYVCASASTPIAASLVLKGISPGTALIFLLLGPATNLGNLLIMQKQLGKKFVVINLIAITLVAVLMGSLVDWFYTGKTLSWSLAQHHEHSTLFDKLCAVILVGLIGLGLWREDIRPRWESRKQKKLKAQPQAKSCCHS